MMDDITLALLGDHDAAQRVTERGDLLPCPFCGETMIYEGSLPGEVWYFCGKDECAALGATSDNEYGARLVWNTRAPVLTPVQLSLLGIAREPRIFEEERK